MMERRVAMEVIQFLEAILLLRRVALDLLLLQLVVLVEQLGQAQAPQSLVVEMVVPELRVKVVVVVVDREGKPALGVMEAMRPVRRLVVPLVVQAQVGEQHGGTGADINNPGNPGNFPGGGGGGEGNNGGGTGGGSAGLIIVSYIDMTAPTLTLTLPVASTITNNTKVTYTVSENLGSGTITWTPTAGPDVTTHVQSLTGGELNTPGQTNHTLTNNPTLVSESTYTVTFSGSDLAGNAATTITVIGVAYDNTPPVASAPTNTAQRLNSGSVSTSTVQSTDAGNIYLILHGTAATTQTQINSAITAKNGFLAQRERECGNALYDNRSGSESNQ